MTELRYQLPFKIHFDDIANHMSICFRTISLARFDFLLGTRVGEATNPGPNDFICSENFHDEIKIVVINPTAVHENIKRFLILMPIAIALQKHLPHQPSRRR